MAHLIEANDSLFSVRQVPWHGIGKILDTPPTSDDAILQAGLGWSIDKTPIHLPNGSVIPDHYANVRSDTQESLGIVTGRYSIVQNREAFTFMDTLIASGDVRYETAGSLRNGRTIWAQARLEDSNRFNLLGDRTVPYIFLANTHDGTGSVRVMVTPVRIVCNNTLNLATKQAQRSWSATHVGAIQAKMKEAERTLSNVEDYLTSLEEQAELLSQVKLSNDKILDILNAVLPHDSKASERVNRTLAAKREGIANALTAPDIRKFQGTGWALVNATTDFLQHSEAMRMTDTFQENRFDRTIKGDPIMDEVTRLVLAVA